ncbi:MAG: ATP-binding protein [Deltaproteobacteria bacterium]|jgi:hypothetical protein|nr:ATP-binding protein [Deltaproteobacteria bacterium]
MKNLPLNKKSSFSNIIKENLLYADKTQYIYEMINRYDFCFLARPRRFGKTLLLDTLEQLFQGNKDFFRGLWIDPDTTQETQNLSLLSAQYNQSNYDFKKHPVIRLDMSSEVGEGPIELKQRIMRKLKTVANEERVNFGSNIFSDALENLFDGLSAKYDGALTVVLVDEYDAPVSINIDNQDIAKANSDVLHDFYGTLKQFEKKIRFSFVTGITRFVLTTMDSGPNMFKDISLNRDFAGICGFTISEFDALFGDRMESVLTELIDIGEMDYRSSVADLRKEILDWFDGYNWLGKERILNPYSILNFFDNREFRSYWPLSGRPKHLSTLIQQRPMDFITPHLSNYTEGDLTISELNWFESAPILFHSGYLTIDKKKIVREIDAHGKIIKYAIYSLKVPNAEISKYYDDFCYRTIFGSYYRQIEGLGPDLLRSFSEKNSENITVIIDTLFANLTYWQNLANERHYHSVLQASFLAAGLNVDSEKAGRDGRSDLIVKLADNRYVIIEVKYLPNVEEANEEQTLAEALDAALARIVNKDYSGPFRIMRPREIIGLGIVFYKNSKVRGKFWEGPDFSSISPFSGGDSSS